MERKPDCGGIAEGFCARTVNLRSLGNLTWRRITMLATYLSAVLALLLLWNVYPKDFNYGAAAGNGLLFYNANVRRLPRYLPEKAALSFTSAAYASTHVRA